MKLLLTSGGLTNDSMINALIKMAGKPLTELNLAFIPTAANIEEGDKSWLIDDLEICKKLQFKSIDIIDISALPQKIWLNRLEQADIILIEGGNTYYLLHWINKSGLKNILPNLLETKIYIGISAGSMVTNPSIILSNSEKKFVEATGIKLLDDGLHLVDFLIEPHINSMYFPDSTFDIIEDLSRNIPYTIYAIDDHTAIQVIDKKISVISEGVWKKFK